MGAVGEVREGTFAGQGRVPIYWQSTAPADRGVRAVMLIAHGFAEHLGRYRGLMEHLAKRGIAAAALDHRGHGRSGGQRGHCRSFAEFTADLRTLAEMAGRWWPGVPQLVFGHSMGGLIVLHYLRDFPDAARAGVVFAPALCLPDNTPRALLVGAMLVARMLPRLPFSSRIDEKHLTRDAGAGRAYREDPLVHNRLTAGFFRALRQAQDGAFASASSLTTPLLMLAGEADRVVPPRGLRELASRLTCIHELKILPGCRHELLNEPPPERARVLSILDEWVDRWV